MKINIKIKNFLFILIFIFFTNISYAKDPLSAIEWLNNSTNINENEKPKKIKNTDLQNIKKSKIEYDNYNGIGVIPEGVSKISKNSWVNVDEVLISNLIESIGDIELIKARRLFKHILIAETNPPVNNIQSKNMGKNFLLARINKLIQIGAFEEANEILDQLKLVNSSIMPLRIKLSYINNDIGEVCKILKQYPYLISNIEPKIICLKYNNDWNAAVIALSSAAAFGRISPEYESLFINYFEPKKNNILKKEKKIINELDVFLIKEKLLLYDFYNLSLPIKKVYYDYLEEKDKKISFTEYLTKKDVIPYYVLFEEYRKNKNNDIISTLIKEFDLLLYQKKYDETELVLKKLIKYLNQKDLLIHFSYEYFSKINHLYPIDNKIELNEMFSLIFLLFGEIPEQWLAYKPKDHEISFAFSLLKNDFLDKPFINSSKQNEIFNSFLKNENSFYADDYNNLQLKSDGLAILTSLKFLEKGHKSSDEEVYKALSLLNKANHEDDSKSIAIELLVHSSVKKW